MTNRSGYCTVRIRVVQRLHKFYCVSKQEGRTEPTGLLAVVNNTVRCINRVEELSLRHAEQCRGAIIVTTAQDKTISHLIMCAMSVETYEERSANAP